MASYEVVFKASVSKDLQPLPRKDVQRILTVCVVKIGHRKDVYRD
jgi:mRNA-degrading endonuclease RelE of RelBE toxin-antitoxin system